MIPRGSHTYIHTSEVAIILIWEEPLFDVDVTFKRNLQQTHDMQLAVEASQVVDNSYLHHTTSHLRRHSIPTTPLPP